MRRLRNPRFVPAILLGFAFAVVLGGCGSKSQDVRFVLPVLGVSYQDSVGPGTADTLFLKVAYQFTNSCQMKVSFEILPVATDTYAVTPVAHYRKDSACAAVAGIDVAVLRLIALGTGPRVFYVTGSNAAIPVTVVAGTPPAATGTRFRIRVVDQTSGLAIPNAFVEIRNVTDNSLVTQGQADALGLYSYDLDCAGDLPYVIHVAGNARVQTLVFRNPPARCGVAEIVLIRV